jgi:uncharacterized protein YjhX (UPF0386 family)
MIKQLMTRSELMEYLGIQDKAYNALLKKGCPTIKVAENKLLFDVDEVLQFLRNGMRAPNNDQLSKLKQKGLVTTVNGRNYITDKGTQKLLSK